MKKFWLAVPVLVLLASGILWVSGQRVVEKPCGCGPPAEEENGEFEADAGQAIFANQPVIVKWAELTPTLEALRGQEGAVLGAQTDERWIEIDLSDQKIYAHNGDKIDYEFLISSGKWAPTPTGEFRVWIKLRYTKMSGGVPGTGTYYYLPNVPYTQYFYKGFGLHGTYWHNNFGHPMSHGCVNLATPDAERLFYWTSPPVPTGKNVVYPSKDTPGTKVVVHE
jgi:hypothetical protein